MLVHICCSVDSHFFLQQMKNRYPGETLIGFFYDPNIHPYSEYLLRLEDVKRSCFLLQIPLHVGPYNYEVWLEAIRGLETEPEKGKRCMVCFDNRLEQTAIKALEIGEKTITTTLLTSPKKSFHQLVESLEILSRRYGLDYVAPDVRKAGGTQAQFALAKQERLYHQNYCGCFFALKAQREAQNRFPDELSMPLHRQVLPGSIEERLALYQQIHHLTQTSTNYTVREERFLNYRLLRATLACNGVVIPSYVMYYSHTDKERIKEMLVLQSEEQGWLRKAAACIVSLKKANSLLGTRYESVKEMLRLAPDFDAEIRMRKTLLPSSVYGFEPIIIVDTLAEGVYELCIFSKTYMDIREVLV